MLTSNEINSVSWHALQGHGVLATEQYDACAEHRGGVTEVAEWSYIRGSRGRSNPPSFPT